MMTQNWWRKHEIHKCCVKCKQTFNKYDVYISLFNYDIGISNLQEKLNTRKQNYLQVPSFYASTMFGRILKLLAHYVQLVLFSGYGDHCVINIFRCLVMLKKRSVLRPQLTCDQS